MAATYPVARAFARRRLLAPRVLVIAPHPDDDAIGCGGTLARLAARGARIAVTYVTDGSASHVKSKRFPPALLRDVREDEARAALQALGVRGRPQFLRAPDSGLTQLTPPERERIVRALAARIAAFRARVIFWPWPRDPHPDHVVSAELAREALDRCGRQADVYFYGVWLAVRGIAGDEPAAGEAEPVDVVLDDAELAVKHAAILAHRSQTGALIDDDPEGFRIDDEMLATWLTPVERFYRAPPAQTGTSRS